MHLKSNYTKEKKENYYGVTLSTLTKNLFAVAYIKNIYDNAVNDGYLISESPELFDDISELYEKYREAVLKIDKKDQDDIVKYEDIINKYELLLDKKNEEQKYQKFFEENFSFLDIHAVDCRFQPILAGEKRPDFLLFLENQKFRIIEIETPDKKLFKKKDVPTAIFNDRINQISGYMTWIRNNSHILRDRDIPINPENTSGVLIIGLRSILSKSQKKKMLEIQYNYKHLFEIKTFDDILNENKIILKNIKKYVTDIS